MSDYGGLLNNLLYPGASIAEKITRSILVYAFLVLMLRLFGKRELAQLNPFDLVVLLLLSNTVQNAIIGNDNSLIGGLIGALALLTVNYLVVRFLFKHRRLDQVLEGTPITLIENGIVNKDAVAKELLTIAELQTVAHRQGLRSLNDVKTLILEPGGSFTLVGKEPTRDEIFRTELLKRFDDLDRQIAELRQKLA